MVRKKDEVQNLKPRMKLKGGVMLGRCRAGVLQRVNPLTGLEEEADERLKALKKEQEAKAKRE